MEDDGKVPYALFVDRVNLAVKGEHVHRGLEAHVVRSLRESVEGRYVNGSYVRFHSAAIVQRTPLYQVQGDPRGTYMTSVEFIADRVAVHPGDRILCRIDALNKLGALGRAGDFQEVKIYLPRDQYQNAAFFEQPEMGVGASVWIEVMPSPKGAQYDAFVVIFGRIDRLEGAAVTQAPELLPAALRRKAPELGMAPQEAPQLGERAPSLSVARLVHDAPSWESVLQGLLKRGTSAAAMERARTLSTPFVAEAPLQDRRFWWELVQRTALMEAEMPLSCLLLVDESAAAATEAHVRSALESLFSASDRLPLELGVVSAASPLGPRPALATAVVAVDPGLPEAGHAHPSLGSQLQTESPCVGRLLTALGSLEPSGTLAAVVLPRATQSFVDWMAWIARHFRDVHWLRPVAMDPLYPAAVLVFEGYQGVSERTRADMIARWTEGSEAMAAGQFVAGLEPSPATQAFAEAWAAFLDRAQRAQVRAVRDALRIHEDDPDAEEQRELEAKRDAALHNWARTFRFPDTASM